MRKVLIILFLFSFTILFSQIRKEVDNGIFVKFPTDPEYTVNEQVTSLTSGTENCLFVALVQRNVVPNYAQYVQAKAKWTEAELKKVEDAFLDNAVKGTLSYTGNKGVVTEIKKGQFRGRKIEYSAINPVTGERGKRFTVMLFVRNSLVSFECWYLNDSSSAFKEKEDFINSIEAK